jgi:WhiB family transcriptional regulator, redox-sensing transcriptional regulator
VSAALAVPAWMDFALCAETDPDLFFPEGQGVSPRKAKSVCARCPVRRPCLAYALEHAVPFGVWGGKSESERRAMLARLPAAAPGHSGVCRGPGQHVRTAANTRVRPDGAIQCKDCERERYLAATSRERAA